MNTNAGKQRKGRTVPGRRSRPFDKSIMNEGLYSNSRIIHSSLLLVGCPVQVQVRNGSLYEGIFKTLSPDGHVALEMAHKVEPNNKDEVPTRDRLINSIVFNLENIVQISATGVDLDYALKDNFTDGAISSKVNNGGSAEKELQPWEAESHEASGAMESLEGKDVASSSSTSTNGWDPEEMFNINADKFDIKSSYDPNLTQYTTPLVKQDTKEYRDREARAARLASEIEKSDDYGRRMALENGDGDDEEMAFSAVHRAGGPGGPGDTSGKYVPPHMRRGPAVRPVRQTPPQSLQSGSQSPHAQSPSPHQQPSPVRTTPVPGVPPPVAQPPPQRSPSQPSPVQVSVSTAVANSDEVDKGQEENRSEPKKKKVPTATLR